MMPWWVKKRAPIQILLQEESCPACLAGAGLKKRLAIKQAHHVIIITMNIQDTLKRAIEESGLSQRGLSNVAGVNRLSIMRFMRGETSLSLEQADRLAEFFGLVLVPEKPVKRTRKGVE